MSKSRDWYWDSFNEAMLTKSCCPEQEIQLIEYQAFTELLEQAKKMRDALYLYEDKRTITGPLLARDLREVFDAWLKERGL